MNFGEFKEKAIQAFKQRFPDSGINVSLGALGKDTVYITWHLGNKTEDFINGIAGNDLLHIMFCVGGSKEDLKDDSVLMGDTLVMEVPHHSVTTTPTSKYLAYGSENLPFRKTTGTPEKIISTLETYANKLYDIIAKLYEEGRIPEGHKAVVEQKLNLNNLKEGIEMKKCDLDDENKIDCTKTETKQTLTEEDDFEEMDDVDAEEEVDELAEFIQEWKDKSKLHDRVISEIIEDSENYSGDTLAQRINARLGDIAHGLQTGVVSSLIYYSDTVAFFNEYWDEIYDLIEDEVSGGLDVLESLKHNCSETEIIMGTDNVKNWVVWLVYGEIAFYFGEELYQFIEE